MSTLRRKLNEKREAAKKKAEALEMNRDRNPMLDEISQKLSQQNELLKAVKYNSNVITLWHVYIPVTIGGFALLLMALLQ